MVRTRDTNVKVAGAKSANTKVAAAAAKSGDSSASKNKYAGGNPYCPRETPAWQKPITQFFSGNGSTSKSDGEPSNAVGSDDLTPPSGAEGGPCNTGASDSSTSSSGAEQSTNPASEAQGSGENGV